MSEEELRAYTKELRTYRSVAPTFARKLDEDIGKARPRKSNKSASQKMDDDIDDLLGTE